MDLVFLCFIRASHCSDCKWHCLVGCDTMQYGRSLLVFASSKLPSTVSTFYCLLVCIILDTQEECSTFAQKQWWIVQCLNPEYGILPYGGSLRRWKVNATTAGSCVMVGFGMGNVEPSSFATIVLISGLGSSCDMYDRSTMPQLQRRQLSLLNIALLHRRPLPPIFFVCKHRTLALFLQLMMPKWTFIGLNCTK